MATVKQRLAIKKVLEGSSIVKAMRESGYASTTAGVPSKLTSSDAWKELVESKLSDEKLIAVHDKGLRATTYVGINKEVPDYSVRHKYLETAYKLKNRMPKEGMTNAIQINFKDNDL